MSKTVRLAIVGVGNCASSLLQGIDYYRDHATERTAGLLHEEVGGYRIHDAIRNDRYISDLARHHQAEMLTSQALDLFVGPQRGNLLLQPQVLLHQGIELLLGQIDRSLLCQQLAEGEDSGGGNDQHHEKHQHQEAAQPQPSPGVDHGECRG